MDPNALSLAARQLRSYLAPKLGIEESQIMIGHPSSAIKDIEGETGKQYLNLFFYRIEHSAYPSDGSSENPFYVRLHCLITAIGNKETDKKNQIISAGENDLRLIGGVMTWLHKQPSLRLVDKTGQEVVRLQIVLHPLSLDDLNHIWSTQGETPYRLSVAYELALAPIPLDHPRERSPRIAGISADILSRSPDQPSTTATLGEVTFVPAVARTVVDAAKPDWVPHISFFYSGHPAYVLSFTTTAIPKTVKMVAVGKPGEEIKLVWETWDRNQGWTTLQDPRPKTVELQTAILDPADLSQVAAIELSLPITTQGQVLLYAYRDWQRPEGPVTIRSNPLLVTVYQETSA